MVLPSHLIRHYICPPMRITKRVLIGYTKLVKIVGLKKIVCHENYKLTRVKQIK